MSRTHFTQPSTSTKKLLLECFKGFHSRSREGIRGWLISKRGYSFEQSNGVVTMWIDKCLIIETHTKDLHFVLNEKINKVDYDGTTSRIVVDKQ